MEEETKRKGPLCGGGGCGLIHPPLPTTRTPAVEPVRMTIRYEQSQEKELGSHQIHSDNDEQQQEPRSGFRSLVGDIGATLFDPLNVGEPLPLLPEKQKEMLDTSDLKVASPAIATPTKPIAMHSLTSLSVATDPAELSDDADDYYPVDVIEPESNADLEACPRILSDSMMQQLHDQGLPLALQMQKWERIFAIGRDGDSFITLLDCCAPFHYTLLAIRTLTGHILGGFASECWAEQDGYTKKHAYYGTGQSFLFANHPAVQSGYDQDLDPSKELMIYKWTGYNDYCQICDVDANKIAMGGAGDFGLIVRDNFYRGQTGRCATFANPPLVPDLAGQFEIEALEIYGLLPLFQSASPPVSSRLHGSSAEVWTEAGLNMHVS